MVRNETITIKSFDNSLLAWLAALASQREVTTDSLRSLMNFSLVCRTKSACLPYFLKFVMVCLLFFSSMTIFVCGAHASNGIKFSAGITDSKEFTGNFTGKFIHDYKHVDLYLLALAFQNDQTVSDFYSLVLSSEELEPVSWKKGAHRFSSYDCLDSGGWGEIFPVNFQKFEDSGDGLLFLLILVNSNADPCLPENWLDYQTASLITDPLERIPGQTQFVSDSFSDQYRPLYVDAVDGGLKEDDQNNDDESNEGNVEKPDIYKIFGQLLYYANGSAGRLQVVDMSDPENLILRHSVALENMPKDLYTADKHLLLMEQCQNENNVSVIIRSFYSDPDTLSEVNTLEIDNFKYLSSQKCGDRIFITGTSGNTGSGAQIWQDSLICAVNISDPANPAVISQKRFTGYDSEIYLDNDYLVSIVKESWDNTVLHVFNLNAQDDPLAGKAEIRIPGRVPSEYHVSTSDNRLFVIYRDVDIKKGSALLIFNMEEFSDIKQEGKIEGIAPGEELYAAKFQDKRAYLVTFEQTDPLWVVDISDYTSPEIIGELEVPGWSEYLKFHDDKLIALGYDDSGKGRHVSLALFSVKDPLNPVLLDRITPLAEEVSYTSSVAISDDRGFYFNKTRGIIIVPINYYSGGNHSGIEIIQLDSEYNVFEHDCFVKADFNVQRGAMAEGAGDIVVSMGDAALNTVSIGSWEQDPYILGKLRLAVNVEKIAGSDSLDKIYTLGGDFFSTGTSDFMVYDKFEPDALLHIKNSEFIRPEILFQDISAGGMGVIFSLGSSAFRLFDQTTMELGDILKFNNENFLSVSDPFWEKRRLYFVFNKYLYDNEKTVLINSLKRYHCPDLNICNEMPDISIPGVPVTVFDGGRLLCIERSNNVYPYPYYRNDTETDAKEPLGDELSGDEPSGKLQGIRLNMIELSENGGILDRTAFFEQERFGWAEIVCDKNTIYLVSSDLASSKDKTTSVYLINPANLEIMNSFVIEGTYSALKALNNRIVFTSNVYFPYWMAEYEYIPYYNSQNEISVYDFSGETPEKLMTFSTDLPITGQQITMTGQSLFIAGGYKGVVKRSFP